MNNVVWAARSEAELASFSFVWACASPAKVGTGWVASQDGRRTLITSGIGN
jgi:hypothetical protein